MFDSHLSNADMQSVGSKMFESLSDPLIDLHNIGDCSLPEYRLVDACRGKVTGSVQCQSPSICPKGMQYSPDHAVCTKCPLGKYNGEVSTVGCKNCPRGTYADEEGMSWCKKCPIDTYQPIDGAQARDACLPCPDGSHTTKTGRPSLSDCQVCLV